MSDDKTYIPLKLRHIQSRWIPDNDKGDGKLRALVQIVTAEKTNIDLEHKHKEFNQIHSMALTYEEIESLVWVLMQAHPHLEPGAKRGFAYHAANLLTDEPDYVGAVEGKLVNFDE